MPQDLIALLTERAVLRLAGADVRGFLQGLITSDIGRLDRDGALYGGLLTPQGKILFDFFIAADGEALLVDCARDRAQDLARRLTFYRLRAAVEITDMSATHRVAALWREDGGIPAAPAGRTTSFADPRLPAMGLRLIGEAADIEAITLSGQYVQATPRDYAGMRIGRGLADSADIGTGELFPHECNFDQFGGVDFTKGCFVGQEVVSRTEHRGTARKRILPVEAAGGTLAAGDRMVAGDKEVGTILAADDGRGLALVRLDRAGDVHDGGVPLEASGGVVRLRRPDWARFAVPGT